MQQGGQLTTTTEVGELARGAIRGAAGPELMQQMQEHVERFDASVVFDHIEEVDLEQPPHAILQRHLHLQLRRPDHRHRRLRPVPGPAQ